MIVGLDISVNCTGICLHSGEEFQFVRLISGKENPSLWNQDVVYKKLGTNKNLWEKSVSTIAFSKALYNILKPHQEVIKKFNVESTAITLRGFGKSSSVIDLAIYASAAYRVLFQIGAPVHLFAANKIKKKFTGNHKASKQEMINEFLKRHPEYFTSGDQKIDDLIDAYALTQL